MISVLEYLRPEKLDDALHIMGGGEHTPAAGGTDLVLQLRDGRPRKILDLERLGLDFIRNAGDIIEIGSLVTHAAIASNPLIAKSLPVLSRASSLVGSLQIRNRGTVGGNIVNASPCADTVPALLLYDAELVLKSSGGTRTVPLSQFVLGPYRTSLGPGEILHSIICRKAEVSTGWSYIKLGRRQAVNISRMTLATSIFMNGDGKIGSVRISAGSVFPTPSRIPRIERMLVGRTPSQELYRQAANIAADMMIKESGHRWSTPYKKPVLINLLTRALTEAQSKLIAGMVS
ncbi:MAG: hypothetical protein A2W25_11010 [candidate division Zixibacteria bacterium RBG_16_53_22]|nr:MAG: hypothetical protein A2W25_11010 [candidate division Zixibacteria bacterium RBG_16_53_22]